MDIQIRTAFLWIYNVIFQTIELLSLQNATSTADTGQYFISFLLIQVISLKLEGTSHTIKISQHLAFMCKGYIKWYINAKN